MKISSLPLIVLYWFFKPLFSAKDPINEHTLYLSILSFWSVFLPYDAVLNRCPAEDLL